MLVSLVVARASKRTLVVFVQRNKKFGSRIRRRYVVFEVATVAEIQESDLRAAIENKFKDIFGLEGLTLSGLRLIMYDPKLRRGIIRVRSNYFDQLMATLGFVRSINNYRVFLYPLATSGTVRRALKKLRS
ncbi:Rpp14/Pop5 family protein [Acidilobus sp.]|uniref:Rpp14/Pop5 family protein n=1 Tax=Acidilobus sp. TaxID=1872109 RepID=UPI003D017FF4